MTLGSAACPVAINTLLGVPCTLNLWGLKATGHPGDQYYYQLGLFKHVNLMSFFPHDSSFKIICIVSVPLTNFLTLTDRNSLDLLYV